MNDDPIRESMRRLRRQSWHIKTHDTKLEKELMSKMNQQRKAFLFGRSLPTVIAIFVLGGLALAGGTAAVIAHFDDPIVESYDDNHDRITFPNSNGDPEPSIIVDKNDTQDVLDAMQNGGKLLRLDGPPPRGRPERDVRPQ